MVISPKIVLVATYLLALAVLAGLLYVLVKRGIRWYFLRSLNRRVDKVRRILLLHGKEKFQRIDRLLFQLGDVQDREAVEIALQEILQKEGARVGPRLRTVYESMGLIDHYRKRLVSSRRWMERAEAARALGQLGIVEAIPQLVERMRDPYEDVQTVKQAASQALGQMTAREAIPLLLQELAQPDDWASPHIAEQLLGFGDKAREALKQALGDEESTNARMWAAQILGRLGDRSAAMALVARLQDRSDQVRISVAEALGRLGDPRTIADLSRLALRDPLPSVRAEAARALGQIGDPSVLDELVLLLSSSDYWTRLRAVEAIEKLRPEDTFALEQALVDSSKVVRGEAARALERLGVLDRRLQELEANDRDVVRAAEDSLVKFGQAGAVESLLKCTQHPRLCVRARICTVLASVGDPYAMPAVIELLQDPMWPVRTRAAEAIGRLRPDGAIGLLVPSLSDDEEMVRIAAIGAIQTIGIDDASESLTALIGLFERGNAEARCSVIASLRSTPLDMIQPMLLQALEDPNVEVRLQAVREVDKRPSDQWTQPLIGLLADADHRVRKEAARALGRVSSAPALRALTESLATPDRDFREILTDILAPLGVDRILELVGPATLLEQRLALVWALGKTLDPGALHELERYAEDPEYKVRAAVAGALGKIRNPRSEQILAALLTDPNEYVRSAAINGIGHLGATGLLPLLLQALDEPYAYVLNRLAVALGRLGEDAALQGLDRLRERARSPEARAYVVLGYGLSGSERGIAIALESLVDAELEPHLQRALAGEPHEVKDRFKRNLVLERATEVDAVTADGLRRQYRHQLQNNREDEQRMAAVRGLQAMGVGDDLDVLMGAVASDPSPAVRRAALASLVPLVKDERVSATMQRALRDPVDLVRLAAVHGLAGARDPANNEILLTCGATGDDSISAAVVAALSRANAGRVDRFIGELTGQADCAVRALGARVLGDVGDLLAQDTLMDWLAEKDTALRTSAILALSQLGTHEAREALVRCLSDPNVRVRVALTEALTRYPLGTMNDPLRRLARDPAVEVRSSLARCLGRRESNHAAALAVELTHDPEEAIRVQALLSLLAQVSAGSIRQFLDCFDDQPLVVRQELYRLPADHEVLDKLSAVVGQDDDPETRVLALNALETLHQQRAGTLVVAMRDPEPAVRMAAVRAASGLEDPELQEMRDRLLHDPVPEVRRLVRKGRLRVIPHPSSE